MDKMCELAKAISDLKLTKRDVRTGLNEFELSVVSRRCKTTADETQKLINNFLEKNINLKFLKNKGDNNNEI